MTNHREMTFGWASAESLDDDLSERILNWLEERGATDVWLGSGPDKHPEDWDAPKPEHQPSPFRVTPEDRRQG